MCLYTKCYVEGDLLGMITHPAPLPGIALLTHTNTAVAIFLRIAQTIDVDIPISRR